MEFCTDALGLGLIIAVTAVVTAVVYQFVIRIFKKGKFKK